MAMHIYQALVYVIHSKKCFRISKNFGPGTNDYLTVDTSGNVGIGTTSPGSYDTAKVGASHVY